MLPCSYKQLFDFSCPFCGFQRSMLLLLEGNIWDSIYQFPIWPLILLYFVCFVFMAIRGKAYVFLHSKIVWSILLIILLFNWVWQNI